MAPNGTHREVEQVKVRDADFNGYQGVLIARMRAVVGAQQALVTGDPAAGYALRQALVDLAAISEALAEGLPAPRA